MARVLFEVSAHQRLPLWRRMQLLWYRRRIHLERDGDRVWATIE